MIVGQFLQGEPGIGNEGEYDFGSQEESHEQGVNRTMTYLESSSVNFGKTDLKFAVNEFSSGIKN